MPDLINPENILKNASHVLITEKKNYNKKYNARYIKRIYNNFKINAPRYTRI